MRSCICSLRLLVFLKTNLHVCHLLGLNTPPIGSKANKYLSILCQGPGEAGTRAELWRVGPAAPASLDMTAPFRRAVDESSCLASPLSEVANRPGVLKSRPPFQAIPSPDEDIQRNPFRQALLLPSSGVPSSPPPDRDRFGSQKKKKKKEVQRDFTGLLSLSISNSSVFNSQPLGSTASARRPADIWVSAFRGGGRWMTIYCITRRCQVLRSSMCDALSEVSNKPMKCACLQIWVWL